MGYESAVTMLNQFIACYNARLERYGTPAPEPVVQLTGTAAPR